MAYKRDIRTRCDTELCERLGTHEVRNRRNDIKGLYCEVHAGLEVKQLDVAEEVAFRKQQLELVSIG